MSGALVRFRIMAWVTGVLLAALSVLGLPAKYVFGLTDEGLIGAAYSFGWIAHGWLYIVYVVAGLDICFRMRYSVGRTLAVLLAGTIPFASFFADHLVTKSVRARLAAQTVT
jgi:integral membrane protein